MGSTKELEKQFLEKLAKQF